MTEAVQTALAPIDNVRKVLESPAMQRQMAMALPRHLTPERLTRVALTAIQQTPQLLECDRKSLYGAIITCAQLGLEPDGTLGQAYLVPFKGRVQFIPGYRGFLSLARNSGEVVSIHAHEVCDKDEFDYELGLEERLTHKPALGDRGEVTHFYAYATFKDGGHHFEVMSRQQVEAIRDRSSGWQAFTAKKVKSSPWETDFVEMGRKTLIRRIAKYLPMNVQKAAALADAYESGRHAELDDHGDLVIDVEAEEVAEEQGTSSESALDAFAGDAEGGGAKDEPPELMSEGKAKAILETAAKLGVSEEQVHEIAADLIGTDLFNVPAEYETEILSRMTKLSKKGKK